MRAQPYSFFSGQHEVLSEASAYYDEDTEEYEILQKLEARRFAA